VLAFRKRPLTTRRNYFYGNKFDQATFVYRVGQDSFHKRSCVRGPVQPGVVTRELRQHREQSVHLDIVFCRFVRLANEMPNGPRWLRETSPVCAAAGQYSLGTLSRFDGSNKGAAHTEIIWVDCREPAGAPSSE
jgi:hypothetical protein